MAVSKAAHEQQQQEEVTQTQPTLIDASRQSHLSSIAANTSLVRVLLLAVN
jgi:hypothetical protein